MVMVKKAERRVMLQAVRDLNVYLCERIPDQSIYTSEQFWQDALKYAGRTILPHALCVEYRTIPYGYLVIHTADGSKTCGYNFVDGECIRDGHSSTPMELCFHGLLDQLLAQRQAQAGTAPGAYTEIANINGFLKGKRSVRAIFQSGAEYQTCQRDNLSADSLFIINHGRLEINCSGYKGLPREGEGLPVSLRYNGMGYSINTNALESLVPQAQESQNAGDDFGSEAATTLMPPSVEKKLLKSRLYSKDGQGKNAEVVVKYFNPYGSGTWLITEGEKQKDGDWLLFGMCHIFEWEWGYIMLSELESVRVPPFGLGLERDLYSSGTVAELMG